MLEIFCFFIGYISYFFLKRNIFVIGKWTIRVDRVLKIILLIVEWIVAFNL